MEEEHNPDYDHEAFLGEDEARAFDQLTPEESVKRLRYDDMTFVSTWSFIKETSNRIFCFYCKKDSKYTRFLFLCSHVWNSLGCKGETGLGGG